jgi:hypothetical protein
MGSGEKRIKKTVALDIAEAILEFRLAEARP